MLLRSSAWMHRSGAPECRLRRERKPACDSCVIFTGETLTYEKYVRAFAGKNALLSLRSSAWMDRSGAPECRLRRERKPASDARNGSGFARYED
jgi:hypothetical protein